MCVEGEGEAGDGSCLDNLRVVLNENERLAEELKEIRDITEKERHTNTQQAHLHQKNSTIQQAMSQIGTKIDLQYDTYTEEVSSLKR